MPPEESGTETPPLEQARWFNTTHWSIVLAAGAAGSAQAQEALEILCRTYWYPLYAYTRRRGCDPHQAQDMVQEFFARFLAKNYLQGLTPDRGKFRSFLLASLNHFLANERDRARALKRGGDRAFISLDDEGAEERFRHEPASELTPEMIFERRWALAVLERALERLRREFVSTGRQAQFERLKDFLEGNVAHGDYDVAAADLNVSSGAVAMAVQRLRQRYRHLVRDEVAQTVADPSEIEAELRHLATVLAK